jgi:pyruvate dehydrogenase E1 component alpha subunit
MKTYRYRGHSMSDPAKYRTKEELEEYKSKDPIEQVLAVLQKNKWIDEKGIEEAEEKVKALVDESVDFAENSPYPTVDELYKDVYTQSDYPYIMDGF